MSRSFSLVVMIAGALSLVACVHAEPLPQLGPNDPGAHVRLVTSAPLPGNCHELGPVQGDPHGVWNLDPKVPLALAIAKNDLRTRAAAMGANVVRMGFFRGRLVAELNVDLAGGITASANPNPPSLQGVAYACPL